MNASRPHVSQRVLIAFAIIGLLAICSVSRADLIPEHLLLVVNGGSTASLAVANEYVRLRGIPDSNILVLDGITNVEQLSVDEFRQQILGPVLTAIQQRGLKSQIRCVVYSADFPTAIHVAGDAKGQTLPQVLTPVASINGLTFLYSWAMSKNPQYLDLNINAYARRFGTRSSDTPWNAAETNQYGKAMRTLQLQSPRPRSSAVPEVTAADALVPVNGRVLSEAIESLVQLKQAHPRSAELLYNLACSLATVDRNGEAMATLKSAVEAGWFDHRHAARDPDLISLHGTAEFQALLNDMKATKLSVLPARGFRSDTGWLPNGEPVEDAVAPRYLLSTVLGITAGRGNTVAEVITQLQRSTTADGSRPNGTVYFVKNGDVRSTTREWGFASAVEQLKDLGVEAAIEEGILPQKKAAVAGAMIGIADFNWPSSESTILPGAIVEHLTSFGGVMTKGAGQTPLTEFLRHGAAGASGTVTEPYAIQAKFPNPFIHVHYASGVTLAEAFYLSVTGPYQLLIVGDPLCSPWRRDLRISAKLPETSMMRGTITLHPIVESSGGLKPVRIEVYVDGKLLRKARPSDALELDTRLLADGSHHLTLLAVGSDAIETTGRWSSHCEVSNRQAKSEFVLKAHGPAFPFEHPLAIETAYPDAVEITIHHLGRPIGTVKGPSGTIQIDPKNIGHGTVTVSASAELSDGTMIHSGQTTIRIESPK